MQVKINVPDRLAVEAQARGISLEIYIEEILDQRLTSAEEDPPRVQLAKSSTESVSCGSKTTSVV
jgi:plasmid stability protein